MNRIYVRLQTDATQGINTLASTGATLNHGQMSEHLYRLFELHPGYKDTRILMCVKCGWSCEPMAQLEDLNPPDCEE